MAESEWLSSELRRRGISTDIGSGWDTDVVTRLCCDHDLIVALGGDGTIIRVARLAAPYRTPVVGINLGRVGFLAEMTPEVLHDRVDALVRRDFWIEQRTMLDVHARIGGEKCHFVCLNEVAVARGLAPRAVHVNTSLDGEEFMTYTADGVLVATATGSTAYSLAAGGPILYPESTDFMITPVAPHLHIGRSTIVPGDTVVTLGLSSDRPAVLSVDGTEEHEINVNDTVEVCRSSLIASFARLGPKKYFYAALALRLR
ncbi:MAG: NAD(+)/NADH kinase [Chloroflexota bacterium]